MKRKKEIDLSEYGLTLAGCVWCEVVMVQIYGDEDSRDAVLKAHVLKDCKKHPMRKLERKLKRLEKKR